MRTRSIVLVLTVMLLVSDAAQWAFGQRGGGRGGAFGSGPPAPHQAPAARPAPNVSVPHIQAPRPIPPARPAPQPRPTPPPAVQRPPADPPQTVQHPPGGGFRPSPRPTTPPPGIVSHPRPTPGGSVPTLGGGNRPLPQRPTVPGIAQRPPASQPRPGAPAEVRPRPGEVGGFLGLHRPVEPRPGPGQPGGGLAPRPGHSPTKPIVTERPAFNRPPNIAHNTAINTRPSWVHLNNAQINTIQNRWHNAFVGPRARPGVGLVDWGHFHPNRVAYWNNWGNSVRYHWHGFHNPNWFSYSWWNAHPHPWGGWHYSYAFSRYPAFYWWRIPTWNALTSWFTWGVPAAVWAQPVYYDYGPGGNVVYQDSQVYVGGEDVGSAADFAQSAAALATVPPPPSEEVAAQAEWMPLGTFAVSSSESDTDPSRVLQLAVDKAGVISGTLYNQKTDRTITIQGQVDKDTQRVAFRFGESDVVAETGLYNLTQHEVPLLVHFGVTRVENYLLVRLDAPQEGDANLGQ